MKIRLTQVKPGDILGIYIGNDCYAFMRLLYLIPGHTYLCEIFSQNNNSLEFSNEIVKSPRLMPLVSANWRSYLNSKLWRAEVVQRDESFVIPSEEIRSTRLMNASQAIRFNLDWTPESDEMLIQTEDVWDEKKHQELSKIHASLDFLANPENLIVEIRNRMGFKPKFDYNNSANRVEMWKWLEDNRVYIKKQD